MLRILRQVSLCHADAEESDDVMAAMLRDIREVCAQLQCKQPEVKFDANTAYALLESNLNKRNRVQLVVKEMQLSKGSQSLDAADAQEGNSPEVTSKTSPENRKNQVKSSANRSSSSETEALASRDRPGTSADADWSIKKRKSSSDTEADENFKRRKLPDEMTENSPEKTTIAEATTNNGDSATQEETDIFQEVEILMKKFPQADGNNVYALLECREGNRNRLQTVIDILTERYSRTTQSTSAASGGGEQGTSHKEERPLGPVQNDPLFQDVQNIARIFPDMDRNEIYALCELHKDHPERMQAVTEELLKDKASREAGNNSGRNSDDIQILSSTNENQARQNGVQPSTSGTGRNHATPGGNTYVTTPERLLASQNGLLAVSP